ncbi:MutS-related protein [Roseateles sp. P5_E1]
MKAFLSAALTVIRRLLALIGWSFSNARPSPVHYDWFTPDEVAGYDAGRPATPAQRVDDQTWSDLHVDDFIRATCREHSILARQYLYRQLRQGRVAAGDKSIYDDRGVVAGETASLKAAADPWIQNLRLISQDLTPFLYRGQRPVLPAWSARLWLMPWAFTALLALLWTAPGGYLAVLLVLYLCVVAFVQIRLYRPLKAWQTLRQALWGILDASRGVAALQRQHGHRLLHELAEVDAIAKALQGRIQLTWYERMAGVAEYANLLFLYEYARFGKAVGTLESLIPDLQRVYEAVARFEGGLALLAHLESGGTHCGAEFADGRAITLERLVHPLVKHPLPLTLSIPDGRGAFISGQNGAGKSTLLRAVGLSLLTARAFGCCYAAAACVPFAVVRTSIGHDDSISASESLYMAEMRRARELLDHSRTNPSTIFLIDELFRGTNNIESVSAGAAVIAELGRRHLVFVTSHNLVLAPLLSRLLIPMNLQFTAPEKNSLEIRLGVMTETNGIDMMRQYGLPQSAIDEALRVFSWFSAYTIQPTTFPQID